MDPNKIPRYNKYSTKEDGMFSGIKQGKMKIFNFNVKIGISEN